MSYLGKDDEAVEAYENGLKHDPNNAQLQAGKQETESKLGNCLALHKLFYTKKILFYHN